MDSAHIVPVKDLRPGLKNLTMILITLDIGKPSTTKDGHEVRSIRVADRTGSVNLSIWDEPGTLLQPGDIIRVHKAYASLFKNSLTLYIGKGGEIYKVGDFCLHFTETPNMSEENFANPAAVPDSPGGSSGQSSGGGRGASASDKGSNSGGPRGQGGNMLSGVGGGGSGGFQGNSDRMNTPGMKHGKNHFHNHVGNHQNNNFGNNHSQQLDSAIASNGIKLHRGK